MKTTKLFVCAAIAATALTSCNNEVDMFETIGSPKATINLGITNDDAVMTRAPQTADNDEWFASVDNAAMAKASTIIGKTYSTESHTIKVANFASEADAYVDAGSAYYEGSETVTLVKGTNTVTINCGTAKNSAVSVDWTGTEGVAGLNVTSVEAVQSSKSRNYTYSAKGDAYFYAGTDVVCTINYSYNNENKTITKTITAPVAATKYALNIGANSNGTITTLTITYDDAMSPGDPTSVTIDAATGNEVVAQP